MDVALRLLSRFLSAHPHEAAIALETAPALEAAAILAHQPPDEAVQVWRRMAIPAAAAALSGMELPSAVALLCRVAAPIAALALARQNLPAAMTLVQACPEPWRAAIDRASHVGAMQPTPPACNRTTPLRPSARIRSGGCMMFCQSPMQPACWLARCATGASVHWKDKTRIQPAELGSVLIDAVELAWTGFAGVIDAAAAAAKELPGREGG